MKSVFFLLFIFGLSGSLAIGLENYNYTIAAIQFSPVGDPSANGEYVLTQNLFNLNQLSIQAAKQGAQIIVWPEGGTGMFTAADNRGAAHAFCENYPQPKDFDPSNFDCLNSELRLTSTIYNASCLAKSLGVTLQVDTCDFKYCNQSSSQSETDPCPKEGYFQYNTLAIFDHRGYLLTIYHKAHLFGETGIFDEAEPVAQSYNATLFYQKQNSQLVGVNHFTRKNHHNNKDDYSFAETTSIQVEFGIFVCFDILYANPALALVNKNIKHFTTSVEWTNIPPSVFAVTTQQGWSRVNNVALIAANIALSVAEAGGGIYVKGEPINVWFEPYGPSGVNKIVLGSVPVDIDYYYNDNKPEKEIVPKYVDEESSASGEMVNCVLGLPPVLLASLRQQEAENPNKGLNYDLLPIGNCSLISGSPSASYSVSLSHHGLNCNLKFKFNDKKVNTSDTFAAVAYKGSILFKETKDPLNLEVCALITCSHTSVIFGYTLCEAVYMTTSVIDSFSFEGSGFNTTSLILPQLALNDVQVAKVQNQNFFNRESHASTATFYSNTNTNIQDTWYGGALFGIVPN